MNSPLLERSRVYLCGAGYSVVFRNQSWSDCFVTRAEERWLGRGLTEDDALDDALRQMLPSQLARDVFYARLDQVALETSPAASTETETESATEALSPAELAVQPPFDASITLVDGAPGAELEQVASAAPSDVLPPAEEAAAVAPPPEQLAEAATSVAQPVAAAPEAPAEPATSTIPLAEAFTALDGMLRDIDAQLPMLAKKAAERQRLSLLAWICRARAYEEALPESRPILLLVQRIARRLTEIGKMLWPGSVRALQLATSPNDTMEPHGSEPPPTSWAQAAERAEQRRNEHLLKSAGLDEDGWADSAAGNPIPPEPDALLTKAVADLNALLARAGTKLPEDQDLAAIVRVAQTLRWIRRSVQDHLAWGLAMGRLRRLSQSLGNQGAALRRAIDPAYKPSSPWVPVAAVQPEGPTQQEITAKVVSDLAQIGTGKDALFPWLLQAFDLFSTPVLAEMLRSRRDQVNALSDMAATYEDRRIRRRLRDLLQRLASGSVESMPSSARREVRSSEEEESAPESEDDSILRQLCARVRPHTEGRRVLFASNRADERLEARLTELLGVKMTGCDGTTRRLQSQCERIAQGSYDLVLSATSFQDHAMDGALARATNAAGVPYVRVNRGRPLACVQAIAREFGDGTGSTGKASNRASARVS